MPDPAAPHAATHGSGAWAALMPSEKASRRPRDSGSPSKSKSRSKSKKDKDRDRDAGGQAASSTWISRFCACSEVACCAKKEQIRKEKKEKHRHRSKEKKEKRQTGDSQETAMPDGCDDECGDNDSGETCTSYATESAYSRQNTDRSVAESEVSQAASSRRSRGQRSAAKKPAAAADPGGVRVLNLADIRGQELPVDALTHGGANEGNLSARSGRSEGGRSARSEGGRSARSCRSDAQSEGGRSVASVSVKKYMGYLSEPKSPAEVKKMVKDFVRQMVKGRDMSVLRADGALHPVLCRLTRELDVLKIKAGDQTRKVQLAEVERIVHGAEELSDLETPLDESCATLELTNDGECISFKFPERKASELFTLCLQLFIDGQK